MADSGFEIKSLPIIGDYARQRFDQWGPSDAANWYLQKTENTKSPVSMYPTMGRRHINSLGLNQLIFSVQPRFIYRSINYWYAIVGNEIIRIDKFYNQVYITGTNFISNGGPVWFSYLVVNTITFACFIDVEKIYIYQEGVGNLQVVTDPNAPGNISQDGKLTKPGYIATFGNRIVVSVANSGQFFLSVINLGGSAFNANTCFTTAGSPVFATEVGNVQQFAVLKNTLYIFTEFTTGIWSNVPAKLYADSVNSFPWKKNTTWDWNFGMADPYSLDVDFGWIAFLAQNKNGLLQVMLSNGEQPQKISSKAIDVLLQRYSNAFADGGPFVSSNSNGFLYQYENTIFYRLSAGLYNDYGILDAEGAANSIEFNFENTSWHRCIEANGERNRVDQHIFFNNQHLVTVLGETTVYQFSGSFYDNELRNTSQSDVQAADAYKRYPFRYERVTPIIAEPDQGEFETDFVQIDFVFGESDINFYDGPFRNATFIITEDATPPPDNQPIFTIADNTVEPVYLITEDGNTPEVDSIYYNAIYNPHIELYYSDNGGKSFLPADVREFSQQGVYQWRMRWYQLGQSRNRVYRLVCVSHVPIVILSGTMAVRRSGSIGN